MHAVRTAALSYGIFCIFAPAHLPPAAPYVQRLDRSVDPMFHQVAVTLNYRCPRILSFFLSGLDHQIEHHVAPRVPHVRYRELAPVLEAFCRARGWPYRTLGWGEAISQCFAVMKRPKPVPNLLHSPSSWPVERPESSY